MLPRNLVEDLCNCLTLMGAKIDGIGTSNITINGVTDLKKINYKVIPDRIEVCTFIVAAAITESHLTIQKANSNHINSFLNVMKLMGLKFKIVRDNIEFLKVEN